jgi:diguanylate cyclase (GGDEF)-like protein/PAS domain S-box-containing protein
MASELAASPDRLPHREGSDGNVTGAKWVAVGGFALVAAYALGLLLRPSEPYLRFQADFVYPIAPAVAIVLSVARWRRSWGMARIGWLAIAVALVAWMLGDLDYTYYDLRYGSDPPFPGPADLSYAVGYVAFGVAVPILTTASFRVRDWRWVLDAGLTVIVAGAISWVYVVEPVAYSGYSPRDATIAMAYPIGDFALASLAIIGWYASGGRLGAIRTLIIGGLAAFAVADAGYTYLVTTVGYDNIGNPADPVWMVGYLLLAVAALTVPQVTESVERRQSMLGVVMPYAVAAGICSLALVSFRMGNGSNVLTVAAAVAVLLVIMRQLLTLTENVRLYHELEARTEELTTSEARLRTVVSNAPVVLFAVDNRGMFTLSEGAALAPLGLAPGEVVGRSVRDVYADQPRIIESVEKALRGEEVSDCVDVAGMSFSTQYVPLHDAQGAVTGLIGVATDVSERERFQQQLMHIASHDPLTGLFNRRRLDEELSRTVAEFARHGVPAALLFLDLDQFKDINDGYGHRAGDDLLTGVANLLRAGVRETDIVARLGGDEFAVILTHADGDLAMGIATKLLSILSDHEFMVHNARVRITASAGVAIVGTDGTNSQELLARADIAMYRAKDEGRNRTRKYDTEADAEAQSRSGWQRHIRDALAEDRFVLHAQPIVALPGRTIAMYEMLIRMVLPSGEIVAPASFLGVAERSGSITDIDAWVLSRAIRLIGEARARGEDLHLATNVSGRSLADRGRLLDVIRTELIEQRVPGDHLVIEITETTAMHDLQGATDFARAVRELGCAVSLDDFGVGFSSFAQLKRLPVDYLKIDGSFVVNLARDRTDQQLVATMTAAAHALNKKVVAEFVTDEETLRILTSFGVDYVQGYHLGAPAALRPLAQAA